MNRRLTAEEVFHAARERCDPSERAGFLDGACGDDVALRAKVEALLNADAEAGEFLQVAEEAPASSPPGAGMLAAEAHDLAGETLGRYKLLQQIGEGGFGVVYMAEQRKPVKRRVALKIIKLGMDTRQVIARFEAERQALAMMDHPNIATVFDAGSTDAGRPYFVMEYIRGVPILEYCDSEKLHTRARLELFGQVCHAIQHAHQKGLIHRDIKPSNVLVTMHDGVPVPKVIDFGIAKATSAELTTKTLFSEHRQMIGTPVYMSPEQAEMSGLDIDTRSDIYSLGVLLYELLTGTTPFTQEELVSKGFAEMMRIIREVEPHKPSTRLSTLGETGPRTAELRRATDPKKLSQSLKGDLDWIVMRCLEKDRTRRYETASALATDLRRYLGGEAVLAAPPNTRYRLHKFFKRNKGQVIGGGLLLILLLAGIAGTSWGLVEANRARLAEHERAEGERNAKLDAERKREEAETNLEYARRGNEVLGSVFANLDPNQDYATVAELRNALKANLSKATADLEGAAIGDPLAVAEMQMTLGRSLMGLGAADQAIPLQAKARETRQAELGLDHPDTLASTNDLAMAYWETGDLEAALPLAEEALRRRRATLGPEDPGTFESINNLACIHWKAGRSDQAVPLFEELLEIQEAKLGRDHPVTAGTILNLGANYKDAGRVQEAIPLLEEGRLLCKASFGPDHPTTLIAMTNLAQAYQESGKLDLAVPLFEETIERAKARLGPDHPHTRKTVKSLALAYWSAGQFDRSFPLYEEDFEFQVAMLGRGHPVALEAAANLSGNYLATGRIDRAITLLEETLPRARATLGPEHPTTLLATGNLAAAYVEAGKPDLAIPLREEELELARETLGPEHAKTLESMCGLGWAYHAAGRLDLALPILEETFRTQRATLGPGAVATLRTMNFLGVAYWSSKQLDESIPLFEEALALCEAKLGHSHRLALQVAANLGVNYFDSGRAADAIRLLEETLPTQRATLGPGAPATLRTMNCLGVVYWSSKQLDKSIPLFEEALALCEAKLGRSHPLALQVAANLVVNYRDARRPADAIPLLEETLERQESTLGPDHPGTLTAMSSLATAHWAARRTDTAIPLFEEVLRRRAATLGRDNPETLATVADLGMNYRDAGRFADAIPLLEEAYRASRAHPNLRFAGSVLLDACAKSVDPAKPESAARVLALVHELLADARSADPADSPQLAGQLALLGRALLGLKQWDEAESLIRECVVIREKVQPDTWTTFDAKSLLGEALLGLRKLSEAEPLLLEGYRGMKEREADIPAQARARIPEALGRIVHLYEATGDDSEAAQWRAELEEATAAEHRAKS